MKNKKLDFERLPEFDLMGNPLKTENFFIEIPDEIGDVVAAYTNLDGEKFCFYIGNNGVVVFWINNDNSIGKTQSLSFSGYTRHFRTIRDTDSTKYIWYDYKYDEIPFDVVFDDKELTKKFYIELERIWIKKQDHDDAMDRNRFTYFDSNTNLSNCVQIVFKNEHIEVSLGITLIERSIPYNQLSSVDIYGRELTIHFTKSDELVIDLNMIENEILFVRRIEELEKKYKSEFQKPLKNNKVYNFIVGLRDKFPQLYKCFSTKMENSVIKSLESEYVLNLEDKFSTKIKTEYESEEYGGGFYESHGAGYTLLLKNKVETMKSMDYSYRNDSYEMRGSTHSNYDYAPFIIKTENTLYFIKTDLKYNFIEAVFSSTTDGDSWSKSDKNVFDGLTDFKLIPVVKENPQK